MGVAMLVLGTWLVLRGRFGLTVGDVAAFATVLTTTYKPVKGLAKDWVKLLDAQPSADRFYEVMDTPIGVQDAARRGAGRRAAAAGCRSRTSASPTAASRCSPTSASRRARARWWRSSAAPAPARPR